MDRKPSRHRAGWLLSKRRKLFADGLHALFRNANRSDAPAKESRRDIVVLAIGTVGPGGSERQLVNTAVGLAAAGRLRPIVVCPDLSAPAAQFYRPTLERAGIELVDLKKRGLRGLSARQALYVLGCGIRLAATTFVVSPDIMRLLVFLLKERPGIVHSFLDDTNIKAGVAAVLARVPRIVLSMRSVAPDNFALHRGYMLPGYKALLSQHTVGVCCNSNAGANDYREWLEAPELPIEVVENGVDFDQFVPSPDSKAAGRAKLNFPEDALVVGSIMRLTEEKQPLLWANMAVEISRQMPQVHFVLIGDGPLMGEVRQIVSGAQIEDRVHLLGHVRDVASVLRCLDLLVLTSRLEGLPNALIEAQAIGVPVVTTPAGGAVETLDPGRTGLIAADHTVSAVSQACLELLRDNEQRERMARTAPEFVREKFSIGRMLRNTLRLYEG